MKIVHIIFSFNTGGAELMLLDIINEQCKKENIYLIIVNDSYDNEILKNIDKKVKVHKVNRKAGSKNILTLLKLHWILFKINPDFIHCHNYDLAKILLFRLFRAKAGLTVHDIGIPTDYHEKFNKIFSISRAVKDNISENSNIKSIVVNNGIKFNNIKIKTKKNDLFHIIQVSRLNHEKKGQDILIKALNILVNEKVLVKIKIDFIGEGSSILYLKNLVEKYNLGNYVEFLGLKKREYILSNLSNYDLFVQPSRFEGFGLTVIEAMAAKIPVLVSDIDGPKEIVENGRFGYMFNSEDHDDCAEKILQIIDDFKNDKIKDKMNDIYDVMKHKYDIKNTAIKYLEEYKK